MRGFLAFFLAFFLVGCGYKPISKVANNIMGDGVYIEVFIDKSEPKNSVFIKDAVKEGIVSRLGKRLSDKDSANISISVVTKSLTYQATIYDEYGYISSYRAILNLEFKTKFKDGTIENIQSTGEYDFSIARRAKSTRYADSVISETEKFEAIKEASKEAFDEFISKLAVKGYKNGSN